MKSFILIFLLGISTLMHAQSNNISISNIYNIKDRQYMDINYENNLKKNDSIKVKSFYCTTTDTFLILDHSSKITKFNNQISLNSRDFLNKPFYELVSNYNIMPVGIYKHDIQIIKKDKSIFQKVVLTSVDSAYNILKVSSLDSLKTKPKVLIPLSIVKFSSLLKKKGFNISMNDQHFLVHKNNFFIAAFPIRKEGSKVKFDIDTSYKNYITNDLSNFNLIKDQIKDLQSLKKTNDINGKVRLSSTFSTDTIPYSNYGTQYNEVGGNLSLEVLNIPIIIDGFYTTQDINRPIKSSYINVKYDIQKVKESLLKDVKYYKEKIDASKDYAFMYNNLYNQYCSTLDRQRDSLINEIKNNYDSEVYDSLSKRGSNAFQSLNINHTLSSATTVKDSITHTIDKAVALYQKIETITKELEKYRLLLNTFQNKLNFDSLKDVNNIDELQHLSYKELIRKTNNILPNNKAKHFITGLTNMDIGIFQHQLSSFTSFGNQTKGINLGYDIGFSKIGFSVGNIDFIDRLGIVEKYKQLSTSLSITKLKGTEINLIYYTYSPTSKFKRDDFFKPLEISLPSFRKPVNIYSVNINGTYFKALNIESELAASNSQVDTLNTFKQGSLENLAYKVLVNYECRDIDLNIEGGYEHVGKYFENNTLNTQIVGTSQYKIGINGSIPSISLKYKLEYYKLLHDNLNIQGGNDKIGFTVGTSSKRYPTITLSYKPFSSFRRVDDTFSIQQRPIIGSVIQAKSSYQIKKKYYTLKLNASYITNRSILDTIAYSSQNIQLNGILTQHNNMYMLTIGRNNVHTDNQEVDSYNTNNLMISGNANFKLGTYQLGGGLELSKAEFGINKLGYSLLCNHTLKRIPLTLGINLRQFSYQLQRDSNTSSNTQIRLDLNYAINSN